MLDLCKKEQLYFVGFRRGKEPNWVPGLQAGPFLHTSLAKRGSSVFGQSSLVQVLGETGFQRFGQSSLAQVLGETGFQ